MSGTIDAPWVRLELISRPEAARLVRSMSTAAGEALGFDAELLSDVNTALSEACNNVIQHAYGESPGPFSVELAAFPQGVEVRVRDRGRGIRPPVPDRDGLKVGFALISALADQAEFLDAPDGGAEVRLAFRSPVPGERSGLPATVEECAGGSTWQAELRSGLTGDIVLTVSPVALLGPLLGRIGRALAPSAGFSLQRCSDVYMVSGVLGAHAEQAAENSAISVSLGARNQRLEFALAPLRAGASAQLEAARSAPGADALARLTEEITVTTVNGHETLRVSMRNRLHA